MTTPATLSATPQFAVLDDLVVHYEVCGPANAPALVFANSLGTDLRSWDRVVARLQERFRTVRYDLRGHGLSDTSPGPYRLTELVDDLARLLDFLELRETLVCGLSVGGLIAQGLCQQRPDLVRALVLCDTGARIGSNEMWDQRMAAISAGGIEAVAEPILERWFSSAFRDAREDEVRGWRNMLTRTPVGGYLATCAAIRDADYSAASAAIEVPTLCLCGDEDGATPPALVRALAALIPAAEFELIEGSSHLPCIEQPQVFSNRLLQFAEQHGLA